MAKIKKILARQILDSRGTPTVQADVFLYDGSQGSAEVPSGASTGSHEAFELRDGDPKLYMGKSVLKAVANVEQIIAPVLIGLDAGNQSQIDELMIALDGTQNKSRLGANAILGVSLAVAAAESKSEKLELFQYLRKFSLTPNTKPEMPFGMFNIINGGVHAAGTSDFQEYLVIPLQTESFAKRLECAAEIFQSLKLLLVEKGLAITVGDEGGFAPNVLSNSEPFDLLMLASAKAGYSLGADVMLGIDAAASEFYSNKLYHLSKENKHLTTGQMTQYWLDLADKYPLLSIEDPLNEDDFDSWNTLTGQLSGKIQVVGDDLYTTNIERLKMGIQKKASTAILIKLNQIGTLTETINCIRLAKQNGFKTIISHRSGETEDTFIADLAVAMDAGQIKMGSLSRSERLAKYNRLLKIEEQLTSNH